MDCFFIILPDIRMCHKTYTKKDPTNSLFMGSDLVAEAGFEPLKKPDIFNLYRRLTETV